jgi:hypothetical protein
MHAITVVSSPITLISSFMDISQLIQELKVRTAYKLHKPTVFFMEGK